MSGISGVDIEAWREDEKQTEFNRVHAVNHAGWVVQTLSAFSGWVQVGGPYPSKELAVKALVGWQQFWPKWEFRVYERLK